MRPHDCRIDGMFLVGGRAKARPDLESGIPHPELASPRKAHEGRVPGRACAQHPQNAINRPPLVLYRRPAFATVGEKWIENAPFPVCQIAPTQGCLLP
jgi:hypothetical protein